MKLVNIILLSMSAIAANAIANEKLDTEQYDYQWLRDDSRSNSDVTDYLKQRNNEVEQFQKRLQPLADSLLSEWSNNRPKRANQPWLIDGENEFLLSSIDGERWLTTRKLGEKEETKLLSIGERAEKHAYYELGNWSLSPDGKHVALAEDIVGNEQYQLVVVTLSSGEEQTIATGSDTTMLWSLDGKQIYAVTKVGEDARPAKLTRYSLEGQAKLDMFVETDQAWLVSAYPTSQSQYAVVQSNSESSSEQRLLDLSSGQLLEPLALRRDNVEYYADVANDQLIIQNNVDGDFALYQAKSIEADWLKIYAPHSNATLETYHLFKSGIAVIELDEGQKSLVILDEAGNEKRRELLSAPGSVGWVSRVGDYASDKLRIRSMSMVQPAMWEEFDVSTLTRSKLSQDQYPSYQPAEYQTKRILIDSNGVKVPVTLAYKTSLLTKSSPVILYGYGAYGFTMKPYFMPQTVSLMDRGIIYAVAHVRGSGYFGADWHHEGRGVNKLNGVNDFVAAAKAMTQYQQGRRAVAAIGSSAGGTLVSAAINQSPDLFAAASLNVPFVDVVASMSDSTLPLTGQQYLEWGNPNQPNELAKMSAYDPMSNIVKASYPPLLVRVGWHDRRVPYWEGAKYLTKIKAMSTGTGPYLLYTDFESGHATDRRQSSLRQAMDYAFLINQLQTSE
tara:strand:+ start:1751 stop:3769 length:2019 start_codon:yes stop_codon:yes gene_type:complete